jgi:hypothetical protein
MMMGKRKLPNIMQLIISRVGVQLQSCWLKSNVFFKQIRSNKEINKLTNKWIIVLALNCFTSGRIMALFQLLFKILLWKFQILSIFHDSSRWSSFINNNCQFMNDCFLYVFMYYISSISGLFCGKLQPCHFIFKYFNIFSKT